MEELDTADWGFIRHGFGASAYYAFERLRVRKAEREDDYVAEYEPLPSSNLARPSVAEQYACAEVMSWIQRKRYKDDPVLRRLLDIAGYMQDVGQVSADHNLEQALAEIGQEAAHIDFIYKRAYARR